MMEVHNNSQSVPMETRFSELKQTLTHLMLLEVQKTPLLVQLFTCLKITGNIPLN